jgi:magnesium transporter
MLSIYKTYNETNKLEQISNIEHGCWINLVAPTNQELEKISQETNVPLELLKASLDDEESSRVELEDYSTLIIVDIPFIELDGASPMYQTYPLGIIHTDEHIITVCLKDSKITNDFIEGKIKSFFTFKRSRFILQILYRISTYYLIYLRQIDKKSLLIEKKLHKSMKNKELIQMLTLEKSLVYFSTSLKSNEITLEKMMKIDFVQKYEEDKDVLEDVIIENKQAIEMATIYSNLLSGTMDAFASVISNNLNIVMKFLASITIVMTIPNIISGLFGMNIPNPFDENPFGFIIVIGVIILTCIGATTYLVKKDMF